jgi:hypothetical protein
LSPGCFSFVMLHTVSVTAWRVDQPIARPLPRNRTAQTQDKCTQTFVPRVEFEFTATVSKRKKTVHALDRAVTVIGFYRHVGNDNKITSLTISIEQILY